MINNGHSELLREIVMIANLGCIAPRSWSCTVQILGCLPTCAGTLGFGVAGTGNNSRMTIRRIATRGNIVAEGRSLKLFLLLNDD